MALTEAPPEIRVCLLANPMISVAGHSQPFSMRGLGRVALFLVLLQGASVQRSAMARSLWPGEADEVVANRLRVSLSRLKGLLGPALVTDRNSIRLSGAVVQCDLLEKLAFFREVFDEVDGAHQLRLIKQESAAIRFVGWRQFAELDMSGVLREWDELCRAALQQMAELAAKFQDWDSLDSAWHWMRERGDFLRSVSERFLDSHHARGTLDEGLRILKRATPSEDTQSFQNLKLYAQQLRARGQNENHFETSHYQALGSALLGQVDRYAESLGALVIVPEVQVNLQAVPALYLTILDGISAKLEVGTTTWVGVQSARLSAYASLYDYDRAIEVSKLLFRHTMTPIQASAAWMHYSFSHFQLRQWDEAISSIHEAQKHAREAGEMARFDICCVTEASYLWHLGRVDEARAIYDDYIEKHADSDDFTAGFNRVICLANYAIIELVYGDLEQAKHFIGVVMSERTRYNLTRMLPGLLSLASVIYARTGEVQRATELAIEGLKLTFERGSSREGQLNMEWACGVLAVGGLKSEADQVMNWVNSWRIQTRHTRSHCERAFAESLGLAESAKSEALFNQSSDQRSVMLFLIKCLRKV